MKARDLKCEVCGKGMFDTPLYRNGPTGKIVPWRCIDHVDPQYRPDIETVELCELIAKGKQRSTAIEAI
jgi:hypothetical protein